MRAVGLAAERFAGDRVGAHPEQVEQVLLGHRRTGLDAAAVVEAAQAGAQEDARRCPRRCVVAGQVGGVTRGAVTDRDRLHQVAIARPERHPAYRDHRLLPSPGRPSSRTYQKGGRPPPAPRASPPCWRTRRVFITGFIRLFGIRSDVERWRTVPGYQPLLTGDGVLCEHPRLLSGPPVSIAPKTASSSFRFRTPSTVRAERTPRCVRHKLLLAVALEITVLR